MGRVVITGLALAVIWLLLSGIYDVPLLFVFGAGSVIFILWLSVRAGVLDDEGAPVAMVPGIFFYWFWLLIEIGKSNVVVAREALAIRPRLSPIMFRVPMIQKTGAGRATFANSITMTPGTVSVNLENDEILVHGLTAAVADIEAIAEMGRRVARAERSA